MRRSYIIEDQHGEQWCGGDEWEEADIRKAARYSTLLGASQALCRLAPMTSRSRFPLAIVRWVPVKKRRGK